MTTALYYARHQPEPSQSFARLARCGAVNYYAIQFSDNCDRSLTLQKNEIDDYWTQQSDAPSGQSRLQIEMDSILNVQPLDAQFGVVHPGTVPDKLFPAMFGQPVSPVNAGQVHTYVLLDAAKVPALPERLEASGLEHRCLFKGGAYDELKDVAPWIVRLEDGNIFTRNLFTRSDTPWHLWDAEPGLYLRSRGTLDQMWRHLRKFTRVRDEVGKWFYFRFWETDCLIDYISFAAKDDQSDLRALFGFDPMDPSVPLVQSYIGRNQNRVRTCSVARMSGHNTEIHTEIDMSIVRFLALRSHAYGFVDSYYTGQGLRPATDTIRRARDFSAALVHKYHRYGFKSRYHLGSFVYWALALNGDFETRTPNLQIHTQRVEADPNDRFVFMAREMKRIFGTRVRNYRGHGS